MTTGAMGDDESLLTEQICGVTGFGAGRLTTTTARRPTGRPPACGFLASLAGESASR